MNYNSGVVKWRPILLLLGTIICGIAISGWQVVTYLNQNQETNYNRWIGILAKDIEQTKVLQNHNTRVLSQMQGDMREIRVLLVERR